MYSWGFSHLSWWFKKEKKKMWKEKVIQTYMVFLIPTFSFMHLLGFFHLSVKMELHSMDT